MSWPAALGDQQISTVRVEFGEAQALRVSGTTAVDSTDGEPDACLPAYAFVVDTAGIQPMWQFDAPHASAVPVPFDPTVAARVYQKASAAGEPSLLTYTFQHVPFQGDAPVNDDALVYTVAVDDRVLWFDPQGVPLD